MKATIDKGRNSFKPYTLNIKIETQLEENLLFRVMLANSRIPEMLRREGEITQASCEVLAKMMGEVVDALRTNDAEVGKHPV